MFGKGKRIENVQLLTNDGKPIVEPGQDPPAPAPDPAPNPPADPPPADGIPKAAAPEGQPAERPAEPKPKRIPMAKPKTNRNKPASDEAVLSRARRMARKELKKVATALGMEEYDEEEINKRLAEMTSTRSDNQSALERADGRTKGLEDQNGDLRGKVSQLQRDLTESKRKAVVAQEELDEFKVVHEIAEAAFRVGLRDADYAVELFRRHANKLPDGEDPDVDAYFEGLKNDPEKKYLFKEETVTAGPKPADAAPQQTPVQPSQQTQQPGHQGAPQGQNSIPDQGAPNPANPGGQPKEVNVLEMNPREFSDHTAKEYGFRPSRT